MKNISSLKSSKTESPKTPGGISKSLLTPCRRIGLSRNWKKAGPSPFVSPLSDSTPSTSEVIVEKRQSRKRKERVKSEENDDESQSTPETLAPNDGIVNIDESAIPAATTGGDDLSDTPTRHVEVPCKKKSKTLLSALSKNVQENEPASDKQEIKDIELSKAGESKVNTIQQDEECVTPIQRSRSKGKKANSPNISSKKSKENLTSKTDEPSKMTEASNITTEPSENVVTPVLKSKSRGRKILSPKNISKSDDITSKDNLNKDLVVKESLESLNIQNKSSIDIQKEPKQRSPNELTKKCIVVIQKKIFKTDKKQKVKTQVSYDSDTDDVPLGQLSKEAVENQISTPQEQNKVEEVKTENTEIKETINLVDEEDDFIETKKVNVKKLEDKSTSIGGLKKKPKINKPKTPKPSQNTQNVDFDDEDDFDFDNKKTILIRKTYEKAVRAPQRAKSTGSITQKDIDDLKARIEAKKKMLLARAMTEDTEELRSLIKKWQKGCQDALMELMDLMKTKFPDRQNLDYSEMLSMLKIPANLVGFDEENDCFNTPDDATIVLSKFNE